jgi:hypothetical protein
LAGNGNLHVIRRLDAAGVTAVVTSSAVPVAGRPTTVDLRTRQRSRVCRAARILTALGVRVRVVQPPVPWPRTDRFMVPDAVGWLADLTLVTAVPGTPLAATSPGAVPCPVEIRYRTPDGYLTGDDVPRTLAEVLAARDLVVEVRLQSAVA